MKVKISFSHAIISVLWKKQFLQRTSILRRGVKEDKVQKSHFSEDEVFMTIHVKIIANFYFLGGLSLHGSE